MCGQTDTTGKRLGFSTDCQRLSIIMETKQKDVHRLDETSREMVVDHRTFRLEPIELGQIIIFVSAQITLSVRIFHLAKYLKFMRVCFF